MTKEERIANLLVIRANAEEKAKAWNDAMQNSKLPEARKIMVEIDDAVSEYTKGVKAMCYEDILKAENPALTAITLLTYTTIAAKEEKVDDSDLKVLKIIDRVKPIDLRDLHKHADGGIGADKNWIYQVEFLNKKLTYRRAEELGVSKDNLKAIDDSYAMNSIAKEIDMGKNPVSNTQMLKTLQAVITAIIGKDAEGKEYKVTSHDVAFLLSIYSRKSREALKVSCANHKVFTGYLAEIAHRVVLNKLYEVDFKREK